MTDQTEHNDDQSERLPELFAQHLAGELTPAERVEFWGLVLEPALRDQVHRLAHAAWEMTGETHNLSREKREAILQRVLEPAPAEAPVISLNTKRKAGWKRWWAAASILVLLGLSAYFLFFNKQEKPDTIVKTKDTFHDVKAPASSRAMITLANGNKVYLDSAGEGQLASQGNVKLVKLADGRIAYKMATGEMVREMQYNILSNPRGSKVIDIILSDGSRVWLNAGSSVTYPVAFLGNERKVSITGEAYFEVIHNKSKPFYVTKGNVQVQVLGTHFNVNAYDDENNIKVTLMEGSIEVKNLNSKIKIRPGQQVAMTNEKLAVNNNVDTDEVMAWKNGLFNFNNASLETVMKQLSRWYDVEVKYEGKAPQREFGGKMQRELSLSEVLKLLEKNNIHFKIEEKTILVQP